MLVRSFSQSSENNKDAIADRLIDSLVDRFGSQDDSLNLLEVGSGSGQHAMHFAPRLPAFTWQPTEMPERLQDLQLNIADAAIGNIQTPRLLNVDATDWQSTTPVDVIYTANTLHIMSWESVVGFFKGAGAVLGKLGESGERAMICVYGPFKYAGAFTTPSNEAFNTHLLAHNPESGIRDFESVDALAKEQGMQLQHDFAMPANNQLLIWSK